MNESHLLAIDGIWSMLPAGFAAMGASLAGVTPEIIARVPAASGGGSRSYTVTADGVALIDLNGPLTKNPSWMQAYLGGTSTAVARAMVRAAVADPAVKGLLYRVDSPGGQTAGVSDLADDIAAAAAVKPSCAFIEDLGASAAYWCASAAGKIYANSTALVGSIGTYLVLQDLSKMAADAGVKVHVVKAGAFKGAAVPGTEITGEQLADFQDVVNAINASFLSAVAKGRGMSKADVTKLGDGRVHVGPSAKALGLVDGICSLDAALATLVKTPKPAAAARSAAQSSSWTGTAAEALAEFTTRVQAQLTDHDSPSAAALAVAAADEDLYRAAVAAGWRSSTVASATPPAPSNPAPAAENGNPTMAKEPLTAAQARQKLDRKVFELQQQNPRMPRSRAVATILAAKPKLQAALRGCEATDTPAEAKTYDDPIAEVDARVKQLKASGVEHARAVSRVFNGDRQLHAQYVAAYDARLAARAIPAHLRK